MSVDAHAKVIHGLLLPADGLYRNAGRTQNFCERNDEHAVPKKGRYCPECSSTCEVRDVMEPGAVLEALAKEYGLDAERTFEKLCENDDGKLALFDARREQPVFSDRDYTVYVLGFALASGSSGRDYDGRGREPIVAESPAVYADELRALATKLGLDVEPQTYLVVELS